MSFSRAVISLILAEGRAAKDKSVPLCWRPKESFVLLTIRSTISHQPWRSHRTGQNQRGFFWKVKAADSILEVTIQVVGEGAQIWLNYIIKLKLICLKVSVFLGIKKYSSIYFFNYCSLVTQVRKILHSPEHFLSLILIFFYLKIAYLTF